MIESSRRDQTAVITLAHGKANAFDIEFLAGLRDALAQARDSSDVRAVVVTARGGIFSAGVDLPRLLESDRAYLTEFLAQLSDGLAELFAMPKPVVAAVNGHAIAGGAIIACACDYRVMAAGAARIGVPELRVGVPFPMVPAEIVRYALGDVRAQRAMLAGHVVTADEAADAGFVDEIVDSGGLMERAMEMALSMAQTPPASYARTKQLLRQPVLERWRRLREAHDRGTLEAWDSPEVRGAIRDYVGATLRK